MFTHHLAHDRHYVSVKIALYSDSLERVLVMFYPKGNVYGLPGGHIDKGEDPDTALARELQEELGITVGGATRSDFFFTNRIILGYTALVPDAFETFPSDAKQEYAEWRTKDEIAGMTTLSDAYKTFVLDHWPASQ